jgi:cellulose synthase/poly-beta-1,6-N-acetylglucosamine synthase-like glycosyltransferase
MKSQPVITQVLIEQIFFFVSAALIAFIYLGYPALVFVLSRIFGWPVRRADITPSVSIIIAAYNEEKDIAAKIENSLSLDYPREKLEIIVASDCSSDRTDEIVRSYAHRSVILHRQEVRYGKTMAQHRAVQASTGDILVFSDATTMYEHDVLRMIVRNFADSKVGCVSGQLVYVDRATTAVGKGCRSYWGYEKFLKKCESNLGSLIGVSGCLYAVRRSSQARLAKDMIDDFVIATEIHLQGLRTVYEPEAISLEDTNQRAKDEMRMRVRVIEQTMSALNRYSEVLNPLKHGMFAVQMICHKVLRYTVPLWLIVAFLSNAFLVKESDFYAIIFLAQALFYGAAMIGHFGERAQLKLGPLAIPYYFALVNIASIMAFIKFMRGEKHVVWEPVRETQEPPPPPPEVITRSHPVARG